MWNSIVEKHGISRQIIEYEITGRYALPVVLDFSKVLSTVPHQKKLYSVGSMLGLYLTISTSMNRGQNDWNESSNIRCTPGNRSSDPIFPPISDCYLLYGNVQLSDMSTAETCRMQQTLARWHSIQQNFSSLEWLKKTNPFAYNNKKGHYLDNVQHYPYIILEVSGEMNWAHHICVKLWGHYLALHIHSFRIIRGNHSGLQYI